MPIARAMQIIGGSLSQKLSDRKLNHAFKDLGFDYHRTTSSRGFVVVRRSDMEIKERQTEQLLMTQ
jgi:hypothetical protein